MIFRKLSPFALSLLLLTWTAQAEPQLTPPASAGTWMEVNSDQAVLRSGPSTDDERLTPACKGVRFRVTETQGDWSHVASPDCWIQTKLLQPCDGGNKPVLSTVKVTRRSDGGSDVRARLERPCAWQIHQDPIRHEVEIEFPGTTSQLFEINHDGEPGSLGQGQLRLKNLQPVLKFQTVQPHWGYTTQWDGEYFVLHWNAPPSQEACRSFNGLQICLDAGHGGGDQGAPGAKGSFEKQHNLAVTLALAEMLRERGAIVSLTRDSDRQCLPDQAAADKELAARVQVAREQHAQLYVSIHHNAMPTVEAGRKAHGTDVYFFQPHSANLAQSIAGSLSSALEESSHSYRWRSLGVIRQTDTPAVLVECNYVSNPDIEENLLLQPDYPQRAAKGILEGLEGYLRDAQPR
jgi:N-acetylmuramoyl-L-alanine amidase